RNQTSGLPRRSTTFRLPSSFSSVSRLAGAVTASFALARRSHRYQRAAPPATRTSRPTASQRQPRRRGRSSAQGSNSRDDTVTPRSWIRQTRRRACERAGLLLRVYRDSGRGGSLGGVQTKV